MMQHGDPHIRTNFPQKERQVKQIFTPMVRCKLNFRPASADRLPRTEQRFPFRAFHIYFDERTCSSRHDMVNRFHRDNSGMLIVRDLMPHR